MDLSRFYLLILLIIGLDQGSKQAAKWFLALNQSVTVIPGVLSFTHIQNPGAAFGILKYHTPLLLLITIGLIFVVILFRNKLPNQAATFRYGLALGLGGAIGNLIDRIRLGKVIDFLDLDFWPLQNWPIFNLADISILAGAALIFFYLVQEEIVKGERR